MKHTRIEEEKAVVEQMIRLYCRKYEGHDELCPKLQGTVGLCPQPTRQMPFWRAKAHMQEMSCALLSTRDERAYQDGDEMVGAKNDYLPSNCSHQTSDALKDKLQNKKGPAQADRSLC